jgi:hypothetical protein
MKKMKNVMMVAILCSIMVLSSCTVFRAAQVKSREISGLVTHIPVTADLDVQSTKVQGVYSDRVKKISLDEHVEGVKKMALHNALEKAGADVLIEPMYSIDVVSGARWATVTVRVTGYPATYKNFRSATLKDKELLEIESTNRKAHKSEAAERSK